MRISPTSSLSTIFPPPHLSCVCAYFCVCMFMCRNMYTFMVVYEEAIGQPQASLITFHLDFRGMVSHWLRINQFS